ncbi:ankyrin repeat domain-containing protein [Labrenzia sp. CE80]|uniref:ankyrin repeat domain-containing protein n=1 Tax=Labrenzia sp. CE80 TaxID=1788986 RepID=UPI00129AE22E|nr:ankyrin repeat domain-containing protein [Labrenzia sp. CE80]
MTKSLDQLRRDAKTLRKAHQSNDVQALQRLKSHAPRTDTAALKHADYLHVIAREAGFPSWPALKLAADLLGMDLATKRQRLKLALSAGHFSAVEQFLAATPDIADGDFGLCLGLYRKSDVLAALDKSPQLATDLIATQAPPLTILARSKWFHHKPDLSEDMLAIARALHANGADLNQGAALSAETDHTLSPLYFAIGHANNMALGQWLLDNGANPNDGESLYHSTELGHHDGLRMLLAHGADPKGTNTLLRAMDFHDTEAIQLLLDHGAQVDEFDGTPVGGEAPWVIPALHHAARRMVPADLVTLLLDNGADPNRRFEGTTPYAYARILGHTELADQLAGRGADQTLSPVEAILADAADGHSAEAPLDPEEIPDAYRNIIRMLTSYSAKLDHIKRLVAMGVEYDRPDSAGLTPVQIAGWEGQSEVMQYLLSLKPDLAHINGYGGTLLSTVLHGAENCPGREDRDHIGCLRLALAHGVDVPRRALDHVASDEISEFLRDWASDHPDQIVENGAF